MGPHHNVGYLQQILSSSAFQTADMHTRTLDETLQPSLRAQPSLYEEAIAALAFSVRDIQGQDGWSSVGRRHWEIALRWDQVGLSDPQETDPQKPQRLWQIQQQATQAFTVSSTGDSDQEQTTTFNFTSVQYQSDLDQLSFQYEGVGHTQSLAFAPSSSDPDQLHFQRANGDQLFFEDLSYHLFPCLLYTSPSPRD